MRLGFHYHVPAVFNEGSIYMPGYLGRFVESLALHCEQVLCFLHSPLEHETSLMDYKVTAGNVKLINMGPHTNIMKRIWRSGKYCSLVQSHADEMDILLLRGPSPLLPALSAGAKKPVALLLVGDYVKGVNDLPQPMWRKEIIRIWAHWNKWGQIRAASRSLTFVNSRALREELKGKVRDLHEVRTTTLKDEDFFVRADTCLDKPYRLLYTGRMDRAKGLLQMVEAVSLLCDRGEDVTLTLVGWREPGDPILDQLQELAQEKGISDRVHYLGPKPLGTELFECYKQADIFLVASLASEGFPRVIWEAMANCLPVIATRVGSIPAFIEDSALLVSPGGPQELADAILKLITEPNLRQKLIARGLDLARTNTLEVQSAMMMEKMNAWLKVRHE